MQPYGDFLQNWEPAPINLLVCGAGLAKAQFQESEQHGKDWPGLLSAVTDEALAGKKACILGIVKNLLRRAISGATGKKHTPTGQELVLCAQILSQTMGKDFKIEVKKQIQKWVNELKSTSPTKDWDECHKILRKAVLGGWLKIATLNYDDILERRLGLHSLTPPLVVCTRPNRTKSGNPALGISQERWDTWKKAPDGWLHKDGELLPAGESDPWLAACCWASPEHFHRIDREDLSAVLHLHGHWQVPETIVMDPGSYSDLLLDDADLRNEFHRHFPLEYCQFPLEVSCPNTHVFLCGISPAGLDDPHFKHVFEKLHSDLGPRYLHWIGPENEAHDIKSSLGNKLNVIHFPNGAYGEVPKIMAEVFA